MVHTALIIAKLITMALGIAIAWQAYRGYRRHDSRPMLYVSIGFLLISIGAVIEGILFDVVGLSLVDAGTVQTAIVALGMVAVLYALYGREPIEVEGGRSRGDSDG